MNFWVKDPKSKKRSVTLTLLVMGFFVCTFKLLVSGMTIHGFPFEQFSGMDFAASLGALGALYGYRKTTGDSAEALVESDSIKAAARLEREDKPPLEGPGC